MRKLNLVFLMVLVVGAVLLGAGVHLVHGIQLRRNASALLDRARQDEARNQLDKAQEALGWYLSLRPDDGSTWAWYARLVDRSDRWRQQLERTYLIHEQALRHAPGDRELKRRCADLAMEMYPPRFGDALSLLAELLAGAEPDSPGSAAAELEDLIGQCYGKLAEYKKAEQSFEDAIKHDPHRVDCYDRLARLLRSEAGRNPAADVKIKEMVAKNPDSGRAHALRWRYTAEFKGTFEPAGIKKALALDPDDREILISAIMASEQLAASAAGDKEKGEATAAIRTYVERGNRLFPDDLIFALYLARLEEQEGHLDRAEAVLRRTVEVKPIAMVAFELASNLVQQGKIEGKSEAADLMERLRTSSKGEMWVRYLEAAILFQQKDWAKAIPRLEAARAALGSEHKLALWTNLMLAECHDRLGAEEQRLDALRRAAAASEAAAGVKFALARDLELSGKLDQAISTLSPLASAGGRPEWRLELVRLQLQQTIRLPRVEQNWDDLEQRLSEAKKALPKAVEPVFLLRLDILAARGHLDEAWTLLSQALEREPRNLEYRLAMARITQRQGKRGEALAIIDQTEKDVGPSLPIAMARLDYWSRQGGEAARAAVAKLAEARGQASAANRPAYLDRLGAVAIGLGRPDLARQYWRELADLRPENVRVRVGLLELAIAAGDRDEPERLVEEIHKIEGPQGSHWWYARAALLLERAGRGAADGLEEARTLVAKIKSARPGWWVGSVLDGQLAELSGSVDQAIASYLRALELGNVQPPFVRRLLMLLDEQGRRADIDRVTLLLRDQGAAPDQVMIVQALDLIRRPDTIEQGLALAQRVFPTNSPNAADHLNLGKIYLTAGRGDRAGQEFRRAVELGRGAPENWLAYVQYLVQARQVDLARAAIEDARKVLPPDRATLTLAQCHAAVGDLGQAEALVRKALDEEGKSEDTAVLRLAAEVNLKQDRPDRARQYLDRIQRVPTATPTIKRYATRTLAAILVSTNHPADRNRALALLNRNLGEDPQSVADQLQKASILSLSRTGRGEAIAILERLAVTNRLASDPRFLLAQLYLDQGQESKYRDEMLRLLAAKARNPRHLAHFVARLIDRHELDQARRWLAELKKDDPRGVPALELEARLLDLQKRRPDLLALLEARGRDVPDQIGDVADLLNRFGFAKEAEAAYRTFAARNPGQPERALPFAVFLALRDRVPEAMEILKKASKIVPPELIAAASLPLYDAPSINEAQRRQVEAWVSAAVQKRPDALELSNKLGAIWLRQGRYDQADAMFRKLLHTTPNNADVLNNLAWLLAMRDENKAREALELIDRAIDVRGPSTSLIDTKAVALIRAGQVDRAVQDLSTAQGIDPGNPNLALHLAWAYQTGGKTEEARRALQQAEQLGWKPENCDPLERSLMNKLRRDLGR